MAITNKYNYVYEDNPEYSDVYVNAYLNALAGYGYDQAALDKIAESTFGVAKPAAVTQPATVATVAPPPVTTQTFSDQITAGTPTTEEELLSVISTPASTTGNTTAVGGTTQLSANPTAAELQALYLQNGVSTPVTYTTEQGDQTVYNPIEYEGGVSLWENPGEILGYEGQGENAIPIYADATLGGYSKKDGDFINFYDLNGNLVARDKWNKGAWEAAWDDFGPIISAVATGYLGGIPLGDTGLTAANALNAVRAADSGNVLGVLSNTVGALPSSSFNVAGYTGKDALNAAKFVTALDDGNVAGILSTAGSLTGSSDLRVAGAAAQVLAAADSGNYNSIFNAAVGLDRALTTPGSTGSTASTGSTTVGNFEDNEVTRLKGLGYTNKQIQDYFNNLDNLTGALDEATTTGTTVSGLPTGVQLASLGDGVFRTDVGGVPTYAESTNASSVTTPFGYTLLSTSEADNKPAGSYYDPTANAWFKPDTAVTDLTGSANIQSDLDLFNTSVGDLDQIASTTGTASDDEMADFLASIGITNTDQLTDSGLSNQDILDLIGAADDTVTVTGTTGTTGTDTITGGTDNDDVEELVVTGQKGTDKVTGIDTITGGGDDNLVVDDKGTVTVVGNKEFCPVGTVLNPETGECEAIEDKTLVCDAGYHEENGVCVKDTLTCPAGKVLNADGTACIDEVIITDTKCDPGFVYDEDLKQCVPIKGEDECPTGYHRDEVTGLCVPDETKLECPEGYEPNEAGTACIPVVVIKDKKCPPGQVYDEDLMMCVAVKDESCPTGYHRDEVTGACVPDVEECPTGYHRDEATGQCVKDALVCAEGFELNEAGTECIPVIKVTACPVGQHRDETGQCVPDTVECAVGYHLENGMCVPDVEECPTGYHRDEVTGQCVKDALTCPEGYELNEAGTECIPIVKITECKEGYHRNEEGVCVPDTVECEAGYHLENGVCVPDKKTLECPEGYELNDAGTECIPIVKIEECKEGFHRNEEGVCVPDETKLECPEGYELNDAGTECIPVLEIKDKKCDPGYVYDEDLKQCVPIEDEPCAEGFHLEDGICVPDDDEKCQDGYEKVNGVCVPVCAEGYIRNLATGVCEKSEDTSCPVGQVRNAQGKCVPIVQPPPPPPVVCPTGFRLVNGACVPITTTVTPTYTPSSYYGPGEKIDPIYAGGMDEFNLLATLQELLKEDAPKKDDKKSKDKTKMATGGHLDDLLAEQMTVDDLLKLLR